MRRREHPSGIALTLALPVALVFGALNPVAAQQPAPTATALPATPVPTVAPLDCEQLGRWMRQEVTRVHRWATDRDQVRSHLDAFFASFATGSSKLLQYVGLG